MKKLILAALFLSLPMGSVADQTTNEGLDFANSQKAYINGLGQGVDSKASMYGGSGSTSDVDPCNQPDASGVKHCGGQVVQGQDATQYYGQSPSALQEQGALKAQTDDIGKFVMDSHTERQAIPINRKDPLFKWGDNNKQEMVNLTDTYSGCKNIAYGGVLETFQDRSCTRTGTATWLTTTCQRTLTASCANSDAGAPWWYTASDFRVRGTGINIGTNGTSLSFTAARNANCTGYDTYLDFDIADMATIESWKLTGVTWDDAFAVYVNGTLIWQADGSNWGTDPHKNWGGLIRDRCEWGGVFSRSETRDIKPLLKTGTNTIRIHHQVGGSGVIYLYADAVRYKACTVKEEVSETCAAAFDRAKASIQSTTCSVPGGTRYLPRTSVTKSCWGWTDTWRYEGLPTYAEDPMCNTLRDQGCSPTSTTCDGNNPSGWCQQYTMNFKCPMLSPEKTMSVCGDTLICPDGNCYNGATPANPDNSSNFAQAVTYLEMMKQMKDDLDMDNISVFTGTYLGCDVNKTLIGSNKCCTGGDGTLNDIGISDCNETEMKINQAKKDKRTTLVRTYEKCVQEVLGACIQKRQYYDFCLWPSKLARIVQEKGRAQMGVPITLACNGFKLDDPNELAAIDWSTLDLSEYFSDVIGSYNAKPKPTGDQLQNQMLEQGPAMTQEYTERMKALYGDSK